MAPLGRLPARLAQPLRCDRLVAQRMEDPLPLRRGAETRISLTHAIERQRRVAAQRAADSDRHCGRGCRSGHRPEEGSTSHRYASEVPTHLVALPYHGQIILRGNTAFGRAAPMMMRTTRALMLALALTPLSACARSSQVSPPVSPHLFFRIVA